MTVVHLVRHGCTDAIGTCLAGRAGGWPLNARGQDEVGRLAAATARLPFVAVVASPMLRARQTAEAIAAPRGLAVAIEPGLDEIDFGDWTGRAFAELHRDAVWTTWNVHRTMAQIPGGETMAQAQARALASLAHLRADWPDAEIAAVSHADVVKSVLLALLGAPLELMHRLAIDPASRSVVRLDAHGAEVLAVNLPAG